jgi:parallel beta-helix repeat protein
MRQRKQQSMITKIHYPIVTGLFLLFLLSSSATATTYYIDPVNGSMDNDGTLSSPWLTLQEVVEAGFIESKSWSAPYSDDSVLTTINEGGPVQSGDTLVLMSGYHGKVDIHRYVNDETIWIKAGEGQSPMLSQLHFRASSYWSVSGLRVSPVYGELDETSLIRIESHSWTGPSSHITVTDNFIFSIEDCSNWSKDDWLDLSKNGISVGGDDCTIKNNEIRNINFGITVSGDRVVVSGNSVLNFAGDGMRGLGDYGVFEYNFVANAIDINDNHDDGFQSWARDGNPVIGVILRGNTFYTNYNHPNEELLSKFQGIGCFDGYYENWRVVNNLVVVSHYHGISLYGATNSVIVNNTVVDDGHHLDDRMVPWIRLTTHKDGSYGEGNVVRNNIGELSSTDLGVTQDHNSDPGVSTSDYGNYDIYFKDWLNLDYSLKASAPATGAGGKDEAPGDDIRGRVRGARIDAGAYQRATLLPFLHLLMD